eukprot:XP_003728663.1 PREDICTED: uncharacterized protein LOC100889207 isoform X2 [Strongylocentrotus purpuratus]
MEIREMPLSRKAKQKCGGCVSPSRRQSRDSEERTDDDCSVQSLMCAEVKGCHCEQSTCSESSEVVQERIHHHSSISSLAEEGDCLLISDPDDVDNLTDVQGPVTSPMDSIRDSSCQTGMNSGTPHLSEQHCVDTTDPSQGCSRKCFEDHPEALPSSNPQCQSARMSSPVLPSLSPDHLDMSLPSSRPVSQPAATTFQPITSNHSICSMSEHAPLFFKDEQTVNKCIGGTSPSSCEPEECFVILNENDLEEFRQSRCSRTESCLQQCGAPGPKGMSVISMTSFGSLSSGDGPMCRICHEGPLSDEDMLAPCHCSGTLTYQHRKCLEQWLQTRGKDACELCDYHFTTERKGRPFSEWIQQPERIRDRRNILVDCSCFTLLTPLVCVSTWLCLNGAYHYLNFYEERGWEGVGLVTLASILIFIYLFWSLMSLRYHCIVWRTWRKEHQRVHVVMETKDSENNNNNYDMISVVSSKNSNLLGAPSQKSLSSSCAPSPKSLNSFAPSWASPNSYSIPLQAPLASMTSL